VSPPPRDWDPWSGDRGTPLSEIRTICEQLGPIATGLAPRFVAERYSIEVEASSTGAHVFLSSVGGRMSDQGGALRIPLAQASSGVVIWTGQALSLALSRLGTALEFGGDRARGGPPLDVFVIDEPERHLHPLAQEDVAAWLGERIREGALVFLATHALPFLDLPWDGVEYLRIVREPSGQARLVPVTQDPIGELSRHSDEAGYRPVQLLQLSRGLLIVEGQQDRKVIEHFYGRELRRARIRILQLQGYQEALALTDANFLLQLGLPIALLLDDIRTEEVEAFRRKRWGVTVDRTPRRCCRRWQSCSGMPIVSRQSRFPFQTSWRRCRRVRPERSSGGAGSSSRGGARSSPDTAMPGAGRVARDSRTSSQNGSAWLISVPAPSSTKCSTWPSPLRSLVRLCTTPSKPFWPSWAERPDLLPEAE
jgi:hypothetical protein